MEERKRKRKFSCIFSAALTISYFYKITCTEDVNYGEAYCENRFTWLHVVAVLEVLLTDLRLFSVVVDCFRLRLGKVRENSVIFGCVRHSSGGFGQLMMLSVVFGCYRLSSGAFGIIRHDSDGPA